MGNAIMASDVVRVEILERDVMSSYKPTGKRFQS